MKKNDTAPSRAWFVKGDHDLQAAEIILKENDPPTDMICFHCQQAVEKYLKGFLVNQGITFFKEHDLIYLLDLCKQKDVSFSELEEPANALNDYAVETRYPFEEEIAYPIEEAEHAIQLVKKAIEFVKSKL